MTPEEFKSSSYYADAVAIGKNKGAMEYVNNNQEHILECSVPDDRKPNGLFYFPIQTYLHYFIYYDTFEAEKIETIYEQIKYLSHTKNDVIHIVQHAKRVIKDNNLKDEYLDGFVDRCDAIIDIAQIELQAALLESQIKANASIILTNDNVVSTNRGLKRIFFGTMIFVAISAIAPIVLLFKSDDKPFLLQKLQEQDLKLKEIQQGQSHISYPAAHPKVPVDSTKP
jgi:hypothetical protein